MQRAKGAAFEREVARAFTDEKAGVAGRRTAQLQAARERTGIERGSDVEVRGNWVHLNVECKHHKRVPVNKLSRLLPLMPFGVLAWKDNGGKPMVTIPLEMFAGMVHAHSKSCESLRLPGEDMADYIRRTNGEG